jgi:hypothetical protein
MPMAEHQAGGLDFDAWAEVARTDPEAFERMRLAAIERCIADAPVQNQERLRRLQWRIDQERRRAGTPLAACIRVSRMMWQSLIGEGGLRDRLLMVNEVLRDGTEAATPPSARVLHFNRSAGR